MGTLQFDDADESRLQIVIITGVAQVQGVGLQRERERERGQVREALGNGRKLREPGTPPGFPAGSRQGLVLGKRKHSH